MRDDKGVLVREHELPEQLSEHQDSREQPHGLPSHGRRIGVLALLAALVLSGAIAATQLLDPKPVTVISGPPKAMPASSTETTTSGCPAPVDDDDVRTHQMQSDVPSHCEAHYDAAQAEFLQIEASLGGLASLVPRLREVFGERYGGNWRDAVGSRAGIAVGLVEPTAADEVRLKELTESERIGIVAVRYSEDQLERWRAAVHAIFKRYKVMGLTGGIDAPRNRIEAMIDVLPGGAAAEIARLVPPDAISIETGHRLDAAAETVCIAGPKRCML